MPLFFNRDKLRKAKGPSHLIRIYIHMKILLPAEDAHQCKKTHNLNGECQISHSPKQMAKACGRSAMCSVMRIKCRHPIRMRGNLVADESMPLGDSGQSWWLKTVSNLQHICSALTLEDIHCNFKSLKLAVGIPEIGRAKVSA